MKGDFSRSTFDPKKHFSGVRMQQGRVQLDADWNENLDILLRRIETETIDVIGECGVPVHDAGFGVVTDFNTLSQAEKDWLTAQGFNTLGAGDFYLTQGRAYVDGIQIENDNTLPFSQQPFVLPKGQGKISADGIYLLYLDVWERLITAIEDPSIREVALGGPDTTARTQVVWQAALANVGNVGDNITCSDYLHPWPDASTGKLSARTQPQDQPTDPCPVPPGAGYKRLENQLYRVEIHKGTNNGGPTYKWSRDNGSVVVSIAEFAVDGANTKIRTTSLGRDDVLGLHENDWVEILDDAAELAGQPGTLVQINKIDPDNVLTLSAPVSGYDINGHPKVRRWDSDGAGGNGIALTSGYVDLEGGIQIQFDTTGTYRTGDYWLIPARTVPGQYGDIEWPQDGGNPAALLPFGIVHHYCKLALLTSTSGAITVEDCRQIFPPLTELPTGGDECCSVTVGQGGDYPDIPSAIAARPTNADWWTICILPGQLGIKDTVSVDGAKSLRINGCGNQCRLLGPQGKPIFKFTNGQDIKLEGLRIEAASADGAILFADTDGIVIANCTAINTASASTDSKTGVYGGAEPLIIIDNGSRIEVRENDLFGLPAIQVNGRDIQILHNRILGGGIQVIPPSSTVEIDDNTILNGMGAGIQLGGGDKTAVDFVKMYQETTGNSPAGISNYTSHGINYVAGIRYVTISNNLIGKMAGSGIITETSLISARKLGDVDVISIHDNQIIACCKTPDVTLNDRSGVGGGIAVIGLFGSQIKDNFIFENGLRRQAACGIFILDGSDIEISGNTILENGSGEDQTQPDSYQAGIAAQHVYGNFLGTVSAGNISGGLLGYPAVRIHGNQVICAAGQALSVTAMGGVMIDGNTFATRERKQQPASPLHFGEKGACVYVLDMGLPVWLPETAVLWQMMSTGQTNIHQDYQKIDALSASLPDGRVLFNNNQVTFNTTQEEVINSLGPLDSGWAQRAWDAATFSTLIISLDDISLNGNQFQATVPLYMQDGFQKYQAKQITAEELWAYLLKFIQVGTAGTVIRANGNGIEERLYSNWVSYASNASTMNLTTSNEATHSLVTNAPKKAEANNLTLF